MNWTPLHAELHKTLRRRQLLGKNRRLLVAVSGGQDSLCLIKLLIDLQPKWQWHLAIAHCDHRWSSDKGIADRVREIARSMQIPFYLKVAGEMKETEAAARQWRYQALVEIASEVGFQDIVTGHTQSDRAETLLYNLIRGSGADGLVALSWKRPLTPQIQLVRPMLDISRAQTFQFCQQFQLPIWEDAVNSNLKYARNRIRAELIPYLQSNFNRQVETALARTAELLRADVEYLEDSADRILREAIISEPIGLDRSYLRPIPLALQRRVVRQFLQKVSHSSPKFEEIEAVVYLIKAPNRSRTSSLPGGAIAEVRENVIVFQNI
ncbi:MAG: tRNA lysidine(34) synthetase TilS [Prochloraceae cyanobacterium]|nr:tRNA lysidine(34) synthetase TilS [Prochloraceae cyanobacterium]